LHIFFENSLRHIYQNPVIQLSQGTEATQGDKQLHEELKNRPLSTVYIVDSNNIVRPFLNFNQLFGLNNALLQGYGQVTHAHVPAKPNITGVTRAWFVVSAGPSGVDVKIEERAEPDGVHKYTIASQPYHITNGIHSVGYLYTDTNGMRVGYTPLVGTTK